MNHYYEDILSRINECPTWWDEHAVPRFGPFSPTKVANIYAREVALINIECQGCGRPFLAALSDSPLSDLILCKYFLYGDPPNIRCCAAGPSMTSNAIRVVEYWKRNNDREWVRDHSLEIGLSDA